VHRATVRRAGQKNLFAGGVIGAIAGWFLLGVSRGHTVIVGKENSFFVRFVWPKSFGSSPALDRQCEPSSQESVERARSTPTTGGFSWVLQGEERASGGNRLELHASPWSSKTS
jgi:hypothetical protein